VGPAPEESVSWHDEARKSAVLSSREAAKVYSPRRKPWVTKGKLLAPKGRKKQYDTDSLSEGWQKAWLSLREAGER